ncbi:MAG TPA: hypothetical protein VHT30_09430 [Acidimicrobiales bacterium]|jgi:hypothetical protein|nr:hypothetical protein [Acidimicrobiales bacterium]
MKRMIVIFAGGIAIVSTLGMGAAMADTPTTLSANPNANSQGSCVGVFSSRVKQNGPTVADQTQAPGGREGAVDAAQAASC